MSFTDAALIDRFIEMLAAEVGASRNTLLAYRSDLAASSALLGGKLVEADAASLARLCASWEPLAKSSVARKSAALRRFYGFLEDERHRADNPSAALPRVSARRGLPKVLTHSDMDALFAAAQDMPLAKDRRMRLLALLELLYGSGLRATELVSLPLRAFRADQPFLIVKGKGDKERLVPVSDRARQAVVKWIVVRPAGSSWMFPSGKGHLSRVRLFQLVREVAVRQRPSHG